MKFSLIKAIKGGGRVHAGKRSFCKKVSIDIPLSKVTFNSILKKNLLPNLKKEKFKGKVSIHRMCEILAIESLVFNQPKSSTQHRILGDVNVFYRPKEITIFGNDTCARYWNMIFFLHILVQWPLHLFRLQRIIMQRNSNFRCHATDKIEFGSSICQHETKETLQTFWMKISFTVIRENGCLQRNLGLKGK